jgi:serine protease DegQ
MQDNILQALSDAMAQAVEKAGVSTVCVDARGRNAASGVILQPDQILTANHVVEREENIRVWLPGGAELRARLLGRDPGSDLCLLALDQGQAVPGTPAETEAQVGQIVLSLGRPEKEGIQASLGVVGAVGGPLRTGRGGLLERFIRTDAIPYPGFSGGPLIDGDGRILGINTSGFAPGASLAIPAAQAWRAAEALRQYGRIRRGFLGIRSQSVELPSAVNQALNRRQVTGLLLVGVERGQPADRAGLMVGDILIGLDSLPIEDHDTLLERLAGEKVGKTVPYEVVRGGRLMQGSIQLEERNGRHQ